MHICRIPRAFGGMLVRASPTQYKCNGSLVMTWPQLSHDLGGPIGFVRGE